MHFGNRAGNFGGSAVRRPVGHDSAAAMSKLVALLPRDAGVGGGGGSGGNLPPQLGSCGVGCLKKKTFLKSIGVQG